MRGTMREKHPGVWELRVYVGRDPVTQAPRQVSRTYRAPERAGGRRRGDGKREAQARLAELVTDAKAGKLAGTDATMTVLLKQYLEHLERKGLSAKTLHAYRQRVGDDEDPARGDDEDPARGTIRAALGSKVVRKLTAWDLDQFYAGLSDGGRAPATVRGYHAIISGALAQAVKWGWCPANVAKMASPPTVRVARIEPPTVEEVGRLVQAAEARDPILAAVILLGALTGARRGELCALRWTDVDLAAGTVRIARSILDLPGQVPVEKATKTHAERTLALGDAGVTLLKIHRVQAHARARAGEAEIASDAFVFSERLDCASPIRPDKVTGFFSRLRDDLNLKRVHFHSLRHFMATQLAARGDISARTLAGRLGHADASVSLKVYSAFFPPADLEAADHLGRVLARPSAT